MSDRERRDLPAEVLHEGDWLRLMRAGTWEYVQRVRARGAAFIVPLTPADELVLVEQFRVPLRARTIELPAGIVGDEAMFADEAIEAAAVRELEEETGFRAGRIEPLLTAPTAPGLSGEMLHLFLASELERVHAGGGVEGEDITVHVVPRAAVPEWLADQRAAGRLIDTRVYAGLWFAAEFQRRNGGAA